MASAARDKKANIMIVDDRSSVLGMMEDLLEGEYDVICCRSAEKALERLNSGGVDVVVCDICMPGMSGMELLKETRGGHEDIEVILMTAYGEVEQAVEALKAGAYDYVLKPFEPDEMVLTIEKAVERKTLRARAAELEDEVQGRYGFENIVGESKPMKRAFKMARKAAASEATVMLSGESGTGKEMFARAIHYDGGRRAGRFVPVNCAAIPGDLLESELFGHVKGAFSGASRDKPGLFEEADGGTLMLDEVTELPPSTQAKINRALQEEEIRRVGGTDERLVDVRVIAATNRDVEAALAEGQLREDLYFRLNVFPINLPPLRERDGDIPLLVDHLLEEFAEKENRNLQVSPEAREEMRRYSWPGNVRELRNVIERAALLAESGTITPADLHLSGGRAEPDGEREVPLNLPYREAMDRMQHRLRKKYVRQMLKRCEGNVTRAAERAGIERESFHRLMKRCGVSRENVKGEKENENAHS
ncbi:MAG: sigma-54-dependent transcriptional regulator [Candidatus Brocadiia bacterium]